VGKGSEPSLGDYEKKDHTNMCFYREGKGAAGIERAWNRGEQKQVGGRLCFKKNLNKWKG